MKRFYAEQAQKSSKRNNACLEVSTSVVVGWWWGGGNLGLAPQGFQRYSHSEIEYPKEVSQLLKTKAGLHRQKSRNDRFGFTLAEVLITLGIIGIVAALTLPTVINNTKKKEHQEALKKAYSTLQQAFLMYQNDIGEVPTKSSFNTETGGFKKAILPYFQVAIDCGLGTNFYDCVRGGGSPYYNYNNTAKPDTGLLNDGQFITADGMMYLFENSRNGKYIFVSVDVNGYKRLPNKWGHDLFTFELTDDGKLLPMGAVGTRYEGQENIYCSKTSSDNLNGIACTNRALYDQSFWK